MIEQNPLTQAELNRYMLQRLPVYETRHLKPQRPFKTLPGEA